MPLATVTAVDVNERALALANENAEALGVEGRFVACLPDAVPSDATYDEIWSNPPIRIGKQALHDLLLTWLPRLRPDGRMVMVVGKNLGADSLQRWLGEQGYPTRRVASAKGFRVLESRPGELRRRGRTDPIERAGVPSSKGLSSCRRSSWTSCCTPLAWRWPPWRSSASR